MNRPAAIAAALAAMLLAGAAAAKRAHIDWQTLQPVGEPVHCLRIPTLGPSHVRSDEVIDFEVGRRLYRNKLNSPCPQLGFEQAFSYRTTITDLCAGDIITVFNHTLPRVTGASCALGTFQLVEPPAS